MRFALLGDDPRLLPLARVIATDPEHELAWVGELPADAPLRRLAPAATWDEPWENLLDIGLVDGVLVGRGQDETLRSDQLRKLVQAGVPLLLAQPI